MEGLNRNKMISLEPGREIRYKGNRGFITGYVDLESLLVREVINGKIERVLIDDVELPHSEGQINNDNDLSLIEEEEWLLAEERLNVIEPLLKLESRTRADVDDQAKLHNKHTNTLYKWIRSYESQGVRGLMRKTRQDRGTKRLKGDVETVIRENIDNLYLASERRSVAYVHRAIVSECKKQGLTPPHQNTIRKRINSISDKKKLKKR